MWELYDDLIASIPAELSVRECLVGLHWTLVRSRATGVALNVRGEHQRLSMAGKIKGKPVRCLAESIKSWNFIDATVGIAALNSTLNTKEQVESMIGRPLSVQKQENAFENFAEKVRGKKVAVIGHFPDLERMSEICELSILERRPEKGDYPDSACEYILPEQDVVFITATTLTNKTLPRLLELSRQAFTVLVGPSTPITPVLFNYGVDVLAGSVVIDGDDTWHTVQEGGVREIFDHGTLMVTIAKEELVMC
ncbi:MAG: DUF364 domain-containing protein [Syntrophaceticus sp.]